MNSTKTHKATARDVALCAKAHISDGDRAAANERCNWWIDTTPIGNGCGYDQKLGRRRAQLRKLGLVLYGANWCLLSELPVELQELYA